MDLSNWMDGNQVEVEILPPLEKTAAREKLDALFKKFDAVAAAGAEDKVLMVLALEIALAEEEVELFEGATVQ